jgi:hypothetical protein
MADPSRDSGMEQPHVEAARDAANWAKAVHRLRVSEVPDGVANINVSGRRAIGPIQGFGRLWQKTYRVPLEGAAVSPAEVVAVWKERFSSFWPSGSRFHAGLSGMAPGAVLLLDQMLPGHLRMSSGVLVLYADEESFTVMAAEGMPFAGWNTFSAFDADGVTVAQVQLLMRASDPLFEAAMILFAHRMEDRHWQRTLSSLAAHFRGRRGGRAPLRVPGSSLAVGQGGQHLVQLRGPFRAVPGRPLDAHGRVRAPLCRRRSATTTLSAAMLKDFYVNVAWLLLFDDTSFPVRD